VEILLPKLSLLYQHMLEAKPPGVTQDIFEATPEKPLTFGIMRLTIIELFAFLFYLDNPSLNKKYLELNIFPCFIVCIYLCT